MLQNYCRLQLIMIGVDKIAKLRRLADSLLLTIE